MGDLKFIELLHAFQKSLTNFYARARANCNLWLLLKHKLHMHRKAFQIIEFPPVTAKI